MEIKVDEAALNAMSQLLGEQFLPTLEFCFSEFERLHSDLADAVEQNDLTSAVRHAHSLKSNAAQFGATSLAESARVIEHNIALADNSEGIAELANLPAQIEQTTQRIRTLV